MAELVVIRFRSGALVNTSALILQDRLPFRKIPNTFDIEVDVADRLAVEQLIECMRLNWWLFSYASLTNSWKVEYIGDRDTATRIFENMVKGAKLYYLLSHGGIPMARGQDGKLTWRPDESSSSIPEPVRT